MSKISTIYDTLRSSIGALLSTKRELPNPYSLEDNPEPYLRDGWGLQIGDGSPGNLDMYREDAEQRSFTLVVTKKTHRFDTETQNLITDSKTVLEDIRTVKNDLLAYDQLGIGSSIQRIEFASASGINFVRADKFGLIYADMTFSIEYTEDILNT